MNVVISFFDDVSIICPMRDKIRPAQITILNIFLHRGV